MRILFWEQYWEKVENEKFEKMGQMVHEEVRNIKMMIDKLKKNIGKDERILVKKSEKKKEDGEKKSRENECSRPREKEKDLRETPIKDEEDSEIVALEACLLEET